VPNSFPDSVRESPSSVLPTSAGPFKIPGLRWVICGLLFVGTLVNYVDRGTIAILAPDLKRMFHWTDSDYGWIVSSFMVAYAIMMLAFGGIIDRVGTRVGYALAMTWWSLAAMGHALARGVMSFALARFMLGAGEAGNFPASIKAVAEWFPKRERALATGIFNSATAVGTVISYPIVGWIFLKWGWQAAFVGTGLLGLVVLVAWMVLFRLPRQHSWMTKAELEYIEARSPDDQGPPGKALAWRAILRYRQAWGFTLAKFMTDPIWWFYIFWLPSYLRDSRHFSVAALALFGTIPWIAAVPGSVGGGWLSGFLLARGKSVTFARKTALLVCALLMPAGILAVFAQSPWWALAFISVATAAHQGWSANVFTLASDTFEKKDVGSVVGLGGAAGAVGGMIIAPVAGYTLQFFHSFVPLFIIAGVMHPLAMVVIHWLLPRIEKVTPPELAEG
jgi:MFS transporter, ACS family, aldohexuronate transporter